MIARVLPTPESLQACGRAGLPPENVVAGQRTLHRRAERRGHQAPGVGVLVTKDGGAEGGVPEKLEAARREGCELVVVARPEESADAGRAFSDVEALVAACVAG